MFSSKKLLVAALALALAWTPAAAQLAQTHAGTVGGPIGQPISNACINSSGTTITFTAQGVGGANPSRISVVSINWSDSTAAGTAELTAMTIGGLSMTRAIRAAGDDQNNNSEIWYVANPTGTSANIVATFSTAVDGVTIEVYRLIGYKSIVATTVGTTSVSQTYSNKQLAIAAGSRTTNVSTSLSNMTNDFSSACGSSLWGVHASSSLKGNGTLTSSISPSSSNPKIAMAVWQTSVAQTPATILSGLKFWYDASVPGSFTLSGATIKNVADQSGNSNDLGDGTTANRPTYSTTAFNGLPSMVFTPNQLIGLTSGAMAWGTGNTITIFMVGSVANLGTPGNGRAVSYYTGINSDWSDPANFAWLRSGSSIGWQRDGVASYGATSYGVNYVMIGTINSSGLMTVYTNGVTNTPVSTAGGNFVSNGNMAIGTSLSDFQYWPGNIAEVGGATGFCNSTCVAQLYGVLKVKWGL